MHKLQKILVYLERQFILFLLLFNIFEMVYKGNRIKYKKVLVQVNILWRFTSDHVRLQIKLYIKKYILL